MPGTHVTTTVQIFIVVVSAATAVATTVQKFIVREGGRKGSLFGALNLLKIGYIYKFNVYILTSLAFCL